MYCSPTIVRVIKSRRLRWAGHVARMDKGMSAFKILTRKPPGKKLLARSRCRWEDNIRTILKGISFKFKNYLGSAQGRDYWRALVNVAQKIRVP